MIAYKYIFQLDETMQDAIRNEIIRVGQALDYASQDVNYIEDLMSGRLVDIDEAININQFLPKEEQKTWYNVYHAETEKRIKEYHKTV